MPDYQLGKIYKIWNNTYTSCYIGSTVEPLSKRMTKHRSDYKRWRQGVSTFVTSFKLFDDYGIENCKIELVENFPCNSREELLSREGYHQRVSECINRIIAGRTHKQYREDSKDKLKEYAKEYYKQNIDKVK